MWSGRVGCDSDRLETESGIEPADIRQLGSPAGEPPPIPISSLMRWAGRAAKEETCVLGTGRPIGRVLPGLACEREGAREILGRGGVLGLGQASEHFPDTLQMPVLRVGKPRGGGPEERGAVQSVVYGLFSVHGVGHGRSYSPKTSGTQLDHAFRDPTSRWPPSHTAKATIVF